MPQTVMVTAAVDDDGAVDPAVTLIHTASGGGYDGIAGSVRVTITENDRPTNRGGGGGGKWRLQVTCNQPIVVMSLLSSPAGHLTNLSTVSGRSETVFPEPEQVSP